MNIWLITLGLGFLFHGLLILWVGKLPWAFRTARKPNFERGSPEAFQIFWLGYIGHPEVFGLAQVYTDGSAIRPDL